MNLALQSDGKLIICGIANDYNGNSINSIARINTNLPLESSSTFVNKNRYKVYPNPNKGQFEIISNDNNLTNYYIYNLMGEELISEKLIPLQKNINIESLSSGMYIIELINSINQNTKESFIISK